MSSSDSVDATDGCCDHGRHKPEYLQERARRREESRRRVEQVALDLFAARGFTAVTVEEVCTKAGIAVATFYRYFSSKEDVFFGYEPQFLEQIGRCVTRTCPEQPPARQVLQFVEAFAAFLESQRESLAQRDALVRDVPALQARTFAIQREWEVAVARALGARRGHHPADEDDQLDAAVCLDVLRGALREWRKDPSGPLALKAGEVLARLQERMRQA